jgi:aldose 1-epimerase
LQLADQTNKCQNASMVELRDNGQLKTAIIESPNGLRLVILNLGAIIQSLEVLTDTGPRNVVLSYPDLEGYLADECFVGATVGPFANRIRGACFQLNGEEITVDASEAATGHCLHGGSRGLHQQFFDLQMDAEKRRIECSTELPDGAGGFPGRRSVFVSYQLIDDSALAVDFRVVTDRDTVVSLANHAYFNLGGAIADHEIRIQANAYTPVDESNAPTGEIRCVADSEFDLRKLMPLGGRRLDQNFVLAGDGNDPRRVATLRSPASGLQLDLHTTQPGLQLYTGDYLVSPFEPRQGLCLEAQGFPDAPNQPGFPSAKLVAGSTYWQRTIYEFSAWSPD